MPARPPKRFFGRVLGGVKKTYPQLPPARQAKIAASVYHKLSPSKKAEIAGRENPGNPGDETKYVLVKAIRPKEYKGKHAVLPSDVFSKYYWIETNEKVKGGG